MNSIHQDIHGRPDVKIAGLQIWIFSRQFETATDYWDGNWVNALVHCGDQGADVSVSGSVIHLSEIRAWLEAVEGVYQRKSDEAKYSGIEPYLSMKLQVADKLGHLNLSVNITPDHMHQKHEFTFEIDLSYLPGHIKELKQLLDKWNVRNKRGH